MSLLSGLFSELENAPAPRFHAQPNMARHDNAAIEWPPMVEVPTATRMNLDHMARPLQLVGHYPKKAVQKVPTLASHATQPPAADEHDGEPQHPILTAVTATPEWIAARDAFINHLMACRACHAPLGRYCSDGAERRHAYNSIPLELAI